MRRQIQDALLDAYARLGSVYAAAEEVGASRESHYAWLRDDSDYARRWEEAQDRLTASLEQAAVERAKVGQVRGIWHRGERVGEERIGSDSLLQFLLRARKPEVYNRDRLEVTGKDGGAIELTALRADALARMTPEQLEALRAFQAASGRQGQLAAALDADSQSGEPVEAVGDPSGQSAGEPAGETLGEWLDGGDEGEPGTGK